MTGNCKKGSDVGFHSKQVPISSKNNRAARNAHARARQEFKTYDTSAIRPKTSKLPIIICVIIIAVIALAVFFVVRSCSSDGELLPEGQEVVVTVEEGSGASAIATDLKKNHVIANTDRFLELVNSKNAAGSLIPGTYLFKGGMTNDQVLAALMAGPASTADTLTVPEGVTREAIAGLIDTATAGRISKQAFLDASADASVYAATYPFLSGVGTNSLEGFLFPKTYAITATDDAKSVVNMMLTQFQTETAGLDLAYPSSVGLDLYGMVKLASIVEKESNTENMPLVASVFYNRLTSDRPYLESDATTAYEVGHDPSGDEVHANTPYSTYSNSGLPPTPICNPSLAALSAVCNPEKSDYMFFFTQNDGTYDFSVTYEDHMRAIGN